MDRIFGLFGRNANPETARLETAQDPRQAEIDDMSTLVTGAYAAGIRVAGRLTDDGSNGLSRRLREIATPGIDLEAAARAAEADHFRL